MCLIFIILPYLEQHGHRNLLTASFSVGALEKLHSGGKLENLLQDAEV